MESSDGTWFLSLPTSYIGMQSGPYTNEGRGDYVELSNNYTTLTRGTLLGLKKLGVVQTHTFMCSIKDFLDKISYVVSFISSANRNTPQHSYSCAHALFTILVQFGKNDDLVPHILHKKEIDEKERANKELSHQLSRLRIVVSEKQNVMDSRQQRIQELSKIITPLRKELNEKGAQIKYLVEKVGKTSDELEELKKTKHLYVSRYRSPEVHVKVNPKQYPTYAQELETACRRAKYMARQQKEAKERLTMLQHDYNAIDSVGSILSSIQ